MGWEDPLEKGKATYSSILAWRIPWTICSPWGRKELDRTEGLSLNLLITNYYDINKNDTSKANDWSKLGNKIPALEIIPELKISILKFLVFWRICCLFHKTLIFKL